MKWKKDRSRSRTYRKHFISLVEYEHLHIVGLQDATLDHIMNTARSSNNNLWTILQGLHVFTNVGAADAGVTFDVHKVTDGDDYFLDLLSKLPGRCENQSLACFEILVDLLEDRDGEGCSFASPRLGLCNDVRSYVTLVSVNSASTNAQTVPLMTGMIARCWIADGRSKP